MKKIISMGLLVLCSSSILFSSTWMLLETENGKVYQDETGKKCEIYSEASLSPDAYDIIINTLNTIWSLPGLTGTEGQVHVENDNYFHFIIFPDSLVYRGVDLKQSMPAGLSFRYDTALFYDVMLKVEDFLPRVTGAYISPNDFLEHLFAVHTMPESYLQGDALVKRIERLENALMAISKKSLFSKPSQVSKDVVLSTISLHNQNPEITVEEVYSVLVEELGEDVTKKDIEAIFMLYLGIFE